MKIIELFFITVLHVGHKTKQMQTLNKKTETKKDDFIDAISAPVKKLDLEGISEGGIFDLLEKAQPGELQKITGSYLSMQINERKAFRFVGMTTYDSDDNGEVEAVQLIDRTGNTFIAANTVIVSSLKRVTVLPTYCVITYEGKKTGKDGKRQYDAYTIEVVPQEIAK